MFESNNNRAGNLGNIYMDADLQKTVKELEEILQCTAKYSESGVPEELQKYVQDFSRSLQGRDSCYRNVMVKHPGTNKNDVVARSRQSRL